MPVSSMGYQEFYEGFESFGDSWIDTTQSNKYGVPNKDRNHNSNAFLQK